VEQHQRQQPEHLGLVRHQRREQLPEPDGLGRQLAANRRVALAEDQIQDRQDDAQALR
jgi:hypothetical protein